MMNQENDGKQSDTPLTDEAIYEEDTGYNGMVRVVSPDFARDLERQLRTAERERDRLHRECENALNVAMRLQVQLDEASKDVARMSYLESRVEPGCFFTINHYKHPSNFNGNPPAEWSEATPIGIGDFAERFAATLRGVIDKEMIQT